MIRKEKSKETAGYNWLNEYHLYGPLHTHIRLGLPPVYENTFIIAFYILVVSGGVTPTLYAAK